MKATVGQKWLACGGRELIFKIRTAEQQSLALGTSVKRRFVLQVARQHKFVAEAVQRAE